MQLLNLGLTSAPATEPVTLIEAKAHLRVVDTAEDTLIGTLISAARQHVENETGRALITQTYTLRLDSWPTVVYLPRPPAISITSVAYTDAAGATHTLSTGAYALVPSSDPGQLIFNSDLLPADALANVAPIAIAYTAGYGAAAAVPQALKQAMLLLLGHWYVNREAVVATGARTSMGETPLAVMALLAPYRFGWFGDWWQ